MGKQLGFSCSYLLKYLLKLTLMAVNTHRSEHDNSEGYVSSFSTLESPRQVTLTVCGLQMLSLVVNMLL